MIELKLQGGLGNQMFQYAAGKAMSVFHNVELKLDISWFERNKLRSYKLDIFNIDADIATTNEINRYTGMYKTRIERILWRLKQRINYFPTYSESDFSFDKNCYKSKKNVYIEGYWHSENYFKDIEKIIRKEFTLKKSLQGRNAEMAAVIRVCNSVSLHIRRGDYITDPINRKKYSVCSLEYYLSAVMKVKEIVQNPHFFVFSDDIPWAQKNLDLPDPVIFVDHNKENQDYEDHQLMRLCDHHIIANSSFSWWGAWLGSNFHKIVISPRKWFNDADRGTRDLIPETWLRL